MYGHASCNALGLHIPTQDAAGRWRDANPPLKAKYILGAMCKMTRALLHCVGVGVRMRVCVCVCVCVCGAIACALVATWRPKVGLQRLSRARTCLLLR